MKYFDKDPLFDSLYYDEGLAESARTDLFKGAPLLSYPFRDAIDEAVRRLQVVAGLLFRDWEHKRIDIRVPLYSVEVQVLLEVQGTEDQMLNIASPHTIMDLKEYLEQQIEEVATDSLRIGVVILAPVSDETKVTLRQLGKVRTSVGEPSLSETIVCEAPMAPMAPAPSVDPTWEF